MKLRIQKNLTFTLPRERNKYPIKDLQVGDGFVIPKDRVPRGPINGLGTRYGMRLTTKKQKDGSVQVIRVA